jgi:predicted PurR-regulated permease PerM
VSPLVRRKLLRKRIIKADRPTVHEYAAWVLAVLSTVFVLTYHLLPALIAGLLVYQLVHTLFPLFDRHISTARAKGAAVGVVAVMALGIVAAAIFGIVIFVRSEGGSVSVLVDKMAEILESSREVLPKWLAEYLPIDAEEMREALIRWLREHAAELKLLGTHAGHMLVHLLIGMVIGAMVSMSAVYGHDTAGPLASALTERIVRMSEAFRRVVFAQLRISALNTAFTAVYLVVVLPLFGVHLPLTKTMIAVTFVVGLLPVVGNLISNSMIFVISVAHSPAVAIASLSFLVVIHKLEYFLNARIVGAQIRAKAWELLTAMLLLESAFGLPGLVAAPICYAWLKDELSSRALI